MTIKYYRDKGTPTRVVRMLNGFGTEARYGVHNDSVKNLVRGIAERVLYTPGKDGLLEPVRKPTDGFFKRLHTLQNRLIRHTTSTTRVPLDKFPEMYTGRKRVAYEKAVQELKEVPIKRTDALVKTFIKAEKINFSAKPDPAPRVIQPRSYRYNVEVGRYLKPFEHKVFEAFEKVYGYKVILKGLNADGVAHEFRTSWDAFHKPVAIGLDASRFDQHVSRDALQFEHRYYNLCFRDPELAELLRWQLHTTGFGRAKDGHVRYEVDGCRMSGDMNTSLGNCIIMASIVLGYFESYGVKARLHNNGDDCTVICEQADLYRLEHIGAWFNHFGFKLTQEQPVSVFECISFCQTQPVLLSSGWRMVRDPRTAMSKDCVSLLRWGNETEFNAWRNAISECGLHLTSGVPIWEKWYQKLWAPLPKAYAVEAIYESGMGFLARGVKKAVITEATRYSFYLAFGILPDDQIALEGDVPEVMWLQPRPLEHNTVLPFADFTHYAEQIKTKERLCSPAGGL